MAFACPLYLKEIGIKKVSVTKMNTYKIPISVKGLILENEQIWLRKNERNEWELPGGKIDENEQPEQALIREIQEELGFEIIPIKLIDASILKIENSKDENKGVLILTYLCKIISKTGSFEIISEGGKAEFAKFSKNEIAKLNMPNVYKEAILK